MYVYLLALCLTGTIGAFSTETAQEVDIEIELDDGEFIENEDVIWLGPGWYYGFWFEDEDGFYEWRRWHRFPRHRGFHDDWNPRFRHREREHHHEGHHEGEHHGHHH